MTPVLHNGLVYTGSGEVLKPNGDGLLYDLYSPSFPTEWTAKEVIGRTREITQPSGAICQPKFQYTPDGLRWVIEVESTDGRKTTLDIALLAAKANTQENPEAALVEAIKYQLADIAAT